MCVAKGGLELEREGDRRVFAEITVVASHQWPSLELLPRINQGGAGGGALCSMLANRDIQRPILMAWVFCNLPIYRGELVVERFGLRSM